MVYPSLVKSSKCWSFIDMILIPLHLLLEGDFYTQTHNGVSAPFLVRSCLGFSKLCYVLSLLSKHTTKTVHLMLELVNHNKLNTRKH